MPFRDEGVLLMRLDGGIVFANLFFCDLVGVEQEKIAEMSCFDFIFPDEMEKAKNHFEACKFATPLPFHCKLRTAQGVPVWTLIQGSAVQSATGEIFGVSATITAAKQP